MEKITARRPTYISLTVKAIGVNLSAVPMLWGQGNFFWFLTYFTTLLHLGIISANSHTIGIKEDTILLEMLFLANS